MSTTPEEKNEYEFLNNEERFQLRRLLSQPEEFPRELGAWMQDYMGTNGFFQKSQVQGLPLLFTQVASAIDALDAQQDQLESVIEAVEAAQITASYGRVATLETTSSGSYTDLATAGPSLTGLEDGTYVIMFGCAAVPDGGGEVALMGVSINGSTPSDTDAAHSSAANVAISTAILSTLSNSNNSTITAKYKQVGGADVGFARRWVLALRIGS